MNAFVHVVHAGKVFGGAGVVVTWRPGRLPGHVSPSIYILFWQRTLAHTAQHLRRSRATCHGRGAPTANV